MRRALGIAVCFFMFGRLTFAEEPNAASFFPESTVVYAELTDTESFINTVLGHPLRTKIESLEDVQSALKSKDYLQFRTAVGLFEFGLGTKWDEAVAKLTSGGIFACVDPKTEGIALLTVADDPKFVTKAIKVLLNFAGGEGDKKNYREREYRGKTAYQLGDAIVAQFDNRLMVSNKPELAKQIADNLLDGTDNSLATKNSFQTAKETRAAQDQLWVYADTEFARNAGIAKELYRDRAENIAAEFILGGITEALKDSNFATLQLQLSNEELTVSVATPYDSSQVSEQRKYYFGENGQGKIPAPLMPTTPILNISTHRDIGRLWLSKEDLLEDDQIAGLTQADSNLTTVFSGLDFGEEVLGAAKPGMQFVVGMQDFSETELPTPDVKLPGFAAVFRLKDPAKVQRRFKIGFQSFMGFINIEQAQQGRPQFDVETTNLENGKIVSASYFADENNQEGLINYNFSPSLAFADEWLVISSTHALAKELVHSAGGKLKSFPRGTNTQVNLMSENLRTILAQNRNQLVAQNMLEEGHSKEEAEKETDLLLDLISATQNAVLTLDTKQEMLQLTGAIRFK